MTKKPKALFIMYDGLTDPLGQSQVLPYLKELSKNYRFDVIGFEKKEIFNSQEKIIKRKIGDSDINWIPISYTKKPPIFSTIYDFIKAWKRAKNESKNETYNLIHCRSSAIGPVALALKVKYKSKLIFDMRGWWPDEKKESGSWKSMVYFPIYKYFKKIEKRLFSESDYAISLTNAGLDEIIKRNLKNKDRVKIIPTCVDFDSFLPFKEQTRRDSRKELQLEESDLVLLYSGSLGGNYSMEIIFGFYRSFKKIFNHTKILFLSQTDTNFIKEEVSSANIPLEDIRIRSCSYDEVSKFLMAGDYGLINYSKTYSTIGRSPTKLGEYWACGLPVLSQSNIGDIDFLLKKYPNSGFLIDILEENRFNLAVKEVTNMSFCKTKLREYSLDYYDLKKGVESYKSVYKEILSK